MKEDHKEQISNHNISGECGENDYQYYLIKKQYKYEQIKYSILENSHRSG